MTTRSGKNPLLRANTKTSVWSQSNPEVLRLEEDKERTKNWKRFGPYLSERQWGTVREDYSSDGGWYVLKCTEFFIRRICPVLFCFILRPK
jgi:hypothetical protein